MYRKLWNDNDLQERKCSLETGMAPALLRAHSGTKQKALLGSVERNPFAALGG